MQIQKPIQYIRNNFSENFILLINWLKTSTIGLGYQIPMYEFKKKNFVKQQYFVLHKNSRHGNRVQKKTTSLGDDALIALMGVIDIQLGYRQIVFF